MYGAIVTRSVFARVWKKPRSQRIAHRRGNTPEYAVDGFRTLGVACDFRPVNAMHFDLTLGSRQLVARSRIASTALRYPT